MSAALEKIIFLDFVHRLLLKKHNVSETGSVSVTEASYF
jgi:hypothetical protein